MAFWFSSQKNKKDNYIPVVTGIGIISPIGEGVDQWWERLCAGASGIDTITQFDASAYPCSAAAEVKNWDPAKYIPERWRRMLSRGSQFIIAALDLAKLDANIEFTEPYNTDVIIGAGSSDYNAMETEMAHNPDFGINYAEDQEDSAWIFKTMLSAPASLVSYRAKTKGYVTTHVSACVSGLDAVNDASRRIAEGHAHTVITGGVDTYVTKVFLQGFCHAKALALDDGGNPKEAVKPFDLERTKSVLGEGACILILEEKKRAQSRHARIYAEVFPGKQVIEHTNVAFTHEKKGSTWSKLMENTAGEGRVDHINAHGPGDKIVDRIEAHAFREAFGARLPGINITSIKPTTGGGNAFASMCQVAATAKAIYEQAVPPTANYKNPDPELEGITPVEHKAKSLRIHRALVSAHGMGGMNATSILEKTK